MKKFFTLVLATATVFGGVTLATHAKPLGITSPATRDTPTPVVAQSAVTSYSNDILNPSLLGARISGLVCDLCVTGIEKQLKSLPFVKEARAFPRDGVVYLGLEGGKPQAEKIHNILTVQGYFVHNLTLSQDSIADASKNPSQFAQTLWKNGAEEQKILMSSEKNQQPTCKTKNNASFDSYQKAW